VKYVIQLAISRRDINGREHNTIGFFCKNIRTSGIEMDNGRLRNKQSKSHADGFMLSVWLVYVILITYSLNSQHSSVVCVTDGG
ncbi:hypothetical protein V4S63_25125, partial [Citrobacter freundii]|uniref:hypothetical protein n=1 Tax=Citrobacter freundii TaxID=546 RepID=UPI002F96CB4C